MTSITPEEFVREYLQAYKLGQSTLDLSIKLGVTDRSVYSRINTYKRKGVKLPPLQASNGRPRVDAEALNKIIEGEDNA